MHCRELKHYLYNNGNILTLGRYGASDVTPEDNFTYTYNGNKLVNLSGTCNGTPLSNANYRYDENGNMTHDGRKGIDITYDVNNMPQTVSRNDTLKAAYTYLSDGTKVMVRDKADNTSSNGYLYLGSMVFRKTGTSYAFESTDFEGGRIINVNGTLTPYYYTTDHLGSVRAITDAGGNVVERNDYYPFGKSMTTGNTYPTMSVNRWKYNGKETQTTGGVNWLDYGARMYDEVIGRWTKPDPMSEKYYEISDYAYCGNNPVKFVDKDGKEIGWPEELLFAILHPSIALDIGKYNKNHELTSISNTAGNFSINLTKDSKVLQKEEIEPNRNAMRHIIWQAIITQEYGQEIAKKVGDAHEDNSNIRKFNNSQKTFDKREDADAVVDLFNNIIGRDIGEGMSKNAYKKEIVGQILNKALSSGYWVVSPVKGGFTITRNKISQKEYNETRLKLNDLNNNGLYH